MPAHKIRESERVPMPDYALVLTSNPEAENLTGALTEEISAVIGRHLKASDENTLTQPGRWLKPAVAWETLFSANDAALVAKLNADLKTTYGEHPVDVNIVPAGPDRRKRLLIADMDSTIIQQECIDEIAAFAGVGPRVAEITERAMRGEIDFEGALKERVGLLAGLDEATLDKVFDTRIQLTPGARTLVATMAAAGAHCALVSGGFTFFTSRVAQAAGFHENHANTLAIEDGHLTGEVVPPILGRAAKLERLELLIRAQMLQPSQTLAVGDGANDLAMIHAAGLGVAFRAKPIVAAEADAGITHGDLTALLYLQGYTSDTFAAT